MTDPQPAWQRPSEEHDGEHAPSGLSHEVLRTALYFDVFQHPLTRAEIERFVRPGHGAAVDAAIDEWVARGALETDGALVFVTGRRAGVAKRRTGARRAERLWPAARRAASVLARFPFVRGVLITGGMSKNCVGEDADVDFLLIVEPGHVWTAKSVLQVWRKVLPTSVRDCFCTNYILAADQLQIDEHNAFTAVELATAVPMFGPEACTALLEANGWAARFVPGIGWSHQRAAAAAEAKDRLPQRVVEVALAGGGSAVETRALRFWDRYWNKKYAWISAMDRSQRFKRRADIATNHLNDFQSWTMAEWRLRLAAHRIPEP